MDMTTETLIFLVVGVVLFILLLTLLICAFVAYINYRKLAKEASEAPKFDGVMSHNPLGREAQSSSTGATIPDARVEVHVRGQSLPHVHEANNSLMVSKSHPRPKLHQEHSNDSNVTQQLSTSTGLPTTVTVTSDHSKSFHTHSVSRSRTDVERGNVDTHESKGSDHHMGIKPPPQHLQNSSYGGNWNMPKHETSSVMETYKGKSVLDDELSHHQPTHHVNDHSSAQSVHNHGQIVYALNT